MKINRFGRALVLSPEQISELFDFGFKTFRDRALFGICFYTASRIGEVCSLPQKNIGSEFIVFRAPDTKSGKTKIALISPKLRIILDEYELSLESPREFYFPGRWQRGHIHKGSADKILRDTFERCGIEGASTHSFRRTAINHLNRAGYDIKTIQKITGHASIQSVEPYLESDPKLIKSALEKL